MFKKPNLAYLTGTAIVEENHLFTDTIRENARPERSTSHMFFQPYESKKEFIYCAHKIVLPLTAGLILFFLPSFALYIALGIFILTMGIYAISGIQRTFGDEASAKTTLNLAEDILSICCQNAVDLLVLPASLTIMLTRGISTGLKAASIYDFSSAPRNDQDGHEEHAREGSVLSM